jgi:SulP family sulfate permease
VRQDTAELANYLLSDHSSGQSPAFLNRTHRPSVSSHVTEDEEEEEDDDDDTALTPTQTIPEVSEPSSPETVVGVNDGPSIIASMLRRSPTQSEQGTEGDQDGNGQSDDEAVESSDEEDGSSVAGEHGKPAPVERFDPHTETTPLLRHQRTNSSGRQNGGPDLESQKSRKKKPWTRGVKKSLARTTSRISTKAQKTVSTIRDPKTWQPKTIYHNVILPPVTCLPAVIVGLLLNILDALSYGMILFPLGSPIFASLGSAGISIFYVSTIVSQLTFSSGSIFRGGVGSELIEVVPFFHSMAATITDLVGEDKPEAVIATTITSYALSAMLTGTVFYCMGRFKFGYLVGFIPRHILIGCIGGVGWFLVATGFEVTARMEGSLNYDLDTLHRLLKGDTVPLWTIPLALAIVLFYAQTKNAGKYFLPLYIIAIPVVFYFFVLSLDTLDPDNLRDNGWIFEGPPPGEPWWYFYTLYRKSIPLCLSTTVSTA